MVQRLAVFAPVLTCMALEIGRRFAHTAGMRGSQQPPASPPRRVIYLVLPGVQLLDLAGPLQVFDTAARLYGARYSPVFCAATPEIRTTQQLHLSRLESRPEARSTDLVLIPGTGQPPRRNRKLVDRATREWLQESYRAGAHLASICSGTAVLGEAGLLAGRRCTTHWESVEELQACYPSAEVVDGVLYVHDGRITTSAGVTSGIDMALWILEQDCGPRVAADVARQLVVYLRRSGLERQVSVHLRYRSHLDPRVHKVQDWLAQHTSEPASLDDLAGVGRTSPRSLTRAFKVATGLSPHQYQQRLRLDLAAHLLRDSDLPLKTIASKSGFGDPRHFRRVCLQHFGLPPSCIRQPPHLP